MSEPLHHEPVYVRLSWNWSWRGIRLGHLSVGPLVFVVLSALVWVVQETLWRQCPWAVSLWVALSVQALVVVLQFRQDPGYLLRQWRRARLPRHLSPFCAGPAEWPLSLCKQGP